MAEKANYPTQPQQPGMYYPPGPVPNPNAPMYPPNDMNQMNAPPSYDQATQPHYQPSPMPNVAYPTSAGHPVQVVGPIHQPAPPTNKTVQVYSGTAANLEKSSVQTHCNSCNNEIYTRVNDKISQNGICWAVTCCFCGSWVLSLLVLCMDAFKVYRHSCPACNAFIGEYIPQMSGGMACLLFFLSLLVIGLQIFVVMVYLNRSYY